MDLILRGGKAPLLYDWPPAIICSAHTGHVDPNLRKPIKSCIPASCKPVQSFFHKPKAIELETVQKENDFRQCACRPIASAVNFKLDIFNASRCKRFCCPM